MKCDDCGGEREARWRMLYPEEVVLCWPCVYYRATGYRTWRHALRMLVCRWLRRA